MAIFYKGAGIGTHWHTLDSQQEGFTAWAPEAAPTTASLINHIVEGPVNSPYISLTHSYAVAWNYAVYGGHEIPMSDHPAYVYEIEIDVPLLNDLCVCYDPVAEVGRTLLVSTDAGVQGAVAAYQHNGLPSLLLGVVDPENMGDFLVGWQPQPPGPPVLCQPNITPPLKTLVNAIRDAEILVYGHIQPDRVTRRFEVVESDLHPLSSRRPPNEQIYNPYRRSE